MKILISGNPGYGLAQALSQTLDLLVEQRIS